MKINKILQEKGDEVVTIAPDDSLEKVATLFSEKRIGSLMVIDHEEIAGIITERDIVRSFRNQNQPLQQRVKHIMTPARELIIVTPEDSVQHAMNIMTREKIKHIPVLSKKRLAGIISIGDVVKSLLEKSKKETRRLQDYISGRYPEE